MTKKRKSKILAAALCTAVMAGIYAAPVMASDLQVIINNELKSYALGPGGVHQGNVKGSFFIAGSDIANALQGENLTLGQLVTTGDATVNGIFTANGSMQVTGRANIGELYVAGNKLVADSNGVRVNGALTAKDVFIDNLSVKGDKFTVNELGEVTAKGAAELNGGLTVNNGATVNGQLTANDGLLVTDEGVHIEQGGLLVDAGLAELNGGLNVTGGAKADSLEVTGQTTLANTKVNGTLTAGATTVESLETTNGKFVVNDDGYTVIDNQLDVTGLANVGELTAGKAGVSGDLQVAGQTTLNGLTATGAANLNGGLNVTGGAKADSLGVTGDTTLAGLTAGNTTVNGTLAATGAADLQSGLKVTGGTETDTLTVTGAATVDSLKVAKDAEIGGNANVKGELYAANNKFSVDENANIFTAGGLTVKEGAMIGGGLSVTDGLAVTGGANITGNSLVTGNLGVTGLTSLTGGLTVSGQTTLNNNLHVNGNADIDGNLKVGTVADVEQSILDLEKYAGELQDANLPDKVGGIERDPAGAGAPGNGTTIIEGMATFNKFGMTIGDTVVTDGAITTNTINAGGTIINNVGMTVGNTVVNDGKITVANAEGETIIEGGAITAKSLVLDSKDVGKTIAGIERETVTDEFGNEVSTTTIEGALKVSDNGLISNVDGSFAVDSNGGLVAGGGTFAADITGITMKAPVQMTLQGDYNYKGQSVIDLGTTISDIDDRLDVLEDKTQNIKPGTGAGTGTGAGGASGLTGGEDTITVPDTAPGHTGITGDVTVGGEINAGEIVVGDKGSDNKTTIDGGNVTVNGGENGSTTINGGNITTGDITASTGNIGSVSMEEGTIKTGDTTIDGNGINTGNGNFKGQVTVGENTTITGEGITTGTGTFDDVTIGGNTTIDDEGIDTNYINADKGNIGNVEMDNNGITVGGGTTITEDTVTTDNIKADDGEFDSQVTVGDNTTITDGNINLGGDNGTNINADGMIVGNANGVNTNVSAGDVVITDKDGKDIALSDVGYVENIDRELQANGNYDGTVVGGINAEADIRRAEVNRLDNRISKVEDRVDKVGAMSAAIANLRTMGYDPAAPTEIAVGIGQYRSETGAALGLFHYPNKDFMLSLSVSTSGDEVMGGIGATWKFGRKSPEKMLAAEKEKAVKAKLAKAEAMKKAAVEAKVAAQQARHAQMAAEKAAK